MKKTRLMVLIAVIGFIILVGYGTAEASFWSWLKCIFTECGPGEITGPEECHC